MAARAVRLLLLGCVALPLIVVGGYMVYRWLAFDDPNVQSGRSTCRGECLSSGESVNQSLGIAFSVAGWGLVIALLISWKARRGDAAHERRVRTQGPRVVGTTVEPGKPGGGDGGRFSYLVECRAPERSETFVMGFESPRVLPVGTPVTVAYDPELAWTGVFNKAFVVDGSDEPVGSAPHTLAG